MAASDQPHVIRLRGPWLVISHSVMRSPGSTCRGTTSINERLPAPARNFIDADFEGRIQLARNFNWPESLGYRETLWLVISDAAWPQFSAELNGERLGAVDGAAGIPADWNITERVKRSNELRLDWEIAWKKPPSGVSMFEVIENLSWVDVQLEVRLEVGPPA